LRHGGRRVGWHCKALVGLAALGLSVRPRRLLSRTHNKQPTHKEEHLMSTSAPNVNQITLVGHLTADPVLRSLPDGRSVCDMRLAVNDQRDQPPLYIDVASFGPSADACAKYLAKGRAIAVTGRLVYREWEADDGSKRSKHQVIGRVRFGGRPDSDQTESEAGDEDGEIEF
jgi:single-strand DNA-binding protein